LPYVKTDYYDVTNFINKFFEQSTDNMFNGFNDSSTLQDIVNMPDYGESLSANSEYLAESNNAKSITDEINIYKTSFHFTNPIYNLVSDGWYSTSKQYNLNEKVSAIEYQFSLLGDANDKGGAIANGLKAEIEKRYGLTLESVDGNYVGYKENGKLNFAIVYSDYLVSLYVGFNKEKLQQLLLTNVSSDVTETSNDVELVEDDVVDDDEVVE